MSTITTSKSFVDNIAFTFDGSDLDLTAANQTAQSVVFSLPANRLVVGVSVQKGATATTSSATLTALNATVGKTAGGTEYLSSTDIKGASTNVRGTPTQAVSNSRTNVYVTLTPAGTGGNFSTLTFGSAVTVTLHTIDFAGAIVP